MKQGFFVRIPMPGRARWLTELLYAIFGKEEAMILTAIVVIIVFIYRAPYRRLELYRRIMGSKTKPYPYDENGKRIYRWNGTPIVPEEEQQTSESEEAPGEQQEDKKE